MVRERFFLVCLFFLQRLINEGSSVIYRSIVSDVKEQQNKMDKKVYSMVCKEQLSFDKKHHPLHVGVPSSLFLSLCDNSNDKEHICLLLCKYSRAFQFLVVIKPMTQLDNTQFIGVTSKFLTHYELNVDQEVSLKAVKVFPLEKVVLGVKHNTFNRLNKEIKSGKFSFNHSTSKSLCRQGDICLLNEVLSSYLDVLTLECVPFHQGYISAKTSVTLVKLKPDSGFNDSTNNSTLSSGSNLDPAVFLNILNYSSQIVLSHMLRNPFLKWFWNDQLNAFGASYRELSQQVSSPLLNVNVLPNCPFRKAEIPGIVDKSAVIFVSSSVLKQYQIVDKSWVEIEIQKKETVFRIPESYCSPAADSSNASPDNQRSHHRSGSSGNSSLRRLHALRCQRTSGSTCSNRTNKNVDKQSRRNSCVTSISFDERFKVYAQSPTDKCCVRKAQIFSLSEDNYSYINLSSFYQHEPGVAFISPLLWFNLNDHPSEFIQPATRMFIRKTSTKTGQIVEPPEYAKELHSALIESVNYQSALFCDPLIKKYFSEPKMIHKGDIFAIDTSDDPTFYFKNCENITSTSLPIVYFKASYFGDKCKSESFIICTKLTKCYIAGSKHSYVPKLIRCYLTSLPLHPIWDSPFPSGLESYVEQLRDTILPFVIDCKSKEQKMPSTIFISGSRGIGKRVIVNAVSKLLNIHVLEINCYLLNGETTASTESKISNALDKAYGPSILLLRKIEAIGRNKNELDFDSRVVNFFLKKIEEFSTGSSEFPVILIGTGALSDIHPSIGNSFVHIIEMKPPDNLERLAMLNGLFSDVTLAASSSFNYISDKTPGLLLSDLCHLSSEAKKCFYRRIMHKHGLNMESYIEESIRIAGVCITQEDIDKGLNILQNALSESFGAPKIPATTWNDVGGLEDVKKEILDSIQLPLDNPNLIKSGLQRSGVLMYGPPGTGKTLLAKAVANECSLNFLSVKGPELINMYVGQSEENIRQVFHQARCAKPCVIFFDELDSLAPNRGNSGDSGGVMDRVVSQLLAEMDGVNKTAQVFVIGATNRPDLLDPALLRPGRFDRLLYVGICDNKQDQLKILKALTKKFHLHDDLDLEEFVAKCPPNLTGADFYALCSESMLNAITRKIESTGFSDADDLDDDLLVQMEDFDRALCDLTPSVSVDELKHYDGLHSSLK